MNKRKGKRDGAGTEMRGKIVRNKKNNVDFIFRHRK